MNAAIRSDKDDARSAASASRPLRVLHVEDSEADADLVMCELQLAGYDVTYQRVDNRIALQNALAHDVWDVVLADYDLPNFSGIAALTLLQLSELDLPFLMVSGAIGEEIAVAAMKAGAHDCIMKDNLARLVPAIERELREAEMRREGRRAQAALQEDACVSSALARVGQELISSLDTPMLIERLCQVTTDVLQCDGTHTILWEPADSETVPLSGAGCTPEQWKSTRVLTLPRALLTDLLERLEQTPVVNVSMTDDPSLTPLFTALGLSAGLFMAVRRGHEIIGIHAAAYRGGQNHFTALQERIARGIAQLASMALENARLVAELARASRVQAELVTTIAHELRTPINTILGYSDLLLGKHLGPLTSKQTDTLERMDKVARALLELINATLDPNRLEAQAEPLGLQDIRSRIGRPPERQ